MKKKILISTYVPFFKINKKKHKKFNLLQLNTFTTKQFLPLIYSQQTHIQKFYLDFRGQQSNITHNESILLLVY